MFSPGKGNAPTPVAEPDDHLHIILQSAVLGEGKVTSCRGKEEPYSIFALDAHFLTWTWSAEPDLEQAARQSLGHKAALGRFCFSVYTCTVLQQHEMK